MKTFKVLLTKSYVITINAENKEDAKRYCEFYTNDISDISTKNDKTEYNFEIESIKSTYNEATNVEEL